MLSLLKIPISLQNSDQLFISALHSYRLKKHNLPKSQTSILCVNRSLELRPLPTLTISADKNNYSMLPGWEKPEMGCIMAVGGAPLAMGCGRGGGPDEMSGGDTPTGRGGRGSGGTPERGAARGGMPGQQWIVQVILGT